MFEFLATPELLSAALVSLLTLTALEIVLGIDNIVFISVLVARLPEEQAKRARQIGLVHRVALDESDLDRQVDETVAQLRTSGPQAVRECKKLIAHVAGSALADAIPYTIEAISERRVSDEGQEGMRAFLAKEKAPWLRK